MACFCYDIATATNSTCTMIYPNVNVTKLFLDSANVGVQDSGNGTDISFLEPLLSCWKGWSYFEFTLISVQHLCAFVFVLHLGE